jgi:polyisoprenoid-binding protein YceI
MRRIPITFRCMLAATAAVASALAFSATGRADSWLLDRQNSEIRFTWDHLGLSRQSGRFLEIDGRAEFTPTDPSGGGVEVTIRAASLTTGVKEYDAILKGPDFFDVARNPLITFRSIGITQTGEKTGEISGELTIMGITRPVILEAAWNFTGEHPFAIVNPTYRGKWVSGFSASTTVLRSEWGLKRGLPLLADEIRIAIEAEFLRRE